MEFIVLLQRLNLYLHKGMLNSLIMVYKLGLSFPKSMAFSASIVAFLRFPTLLYSLAASSYDLLRHAFFLSGLENYFE